MTMSADLSTSLEGTPASWKWPCTLTDQMRIEALYPEVRASVERYIRSRLDLARSNGVRVLGDDAKDDEYSCGWNDGCEAMRDSMESAPVPPPVRRRKR